MTNCSGGSDLLAWGKFNEATGAFHLLEHHCADVAACFETLLANPVLRARFSNAVGGDGLSPQTATRLAVIAFLHDFGKINSGFQFKVRNRDTLPPAPPPKMGHIDEAVFCVAQPDMPRRLGFDSLLPEWGDAVDALLRGALSHHGRPPYTPHAAAGSRRIWEPFAGYDPRAAADLLRRRARAWFPRAFDQGPPLPASPALAHLFAGTVALADQIGSDKCHFPYEPDPDPEYIQRARLLARKAIRARGLEGGTSAARAVTPPFRAMFGHDEPRPLQNAVAAAPLQSPLLILESETGSGKTEAAVMRFAALSKAGLVDGLYFALPTRAAARQLHRRVHRAMRELLPADSAGGTVLAVPGYCVAGDATGTPIGGYQVYWEDRPDERDRVARWAAESTRHFLGANAAVGTVDQALLAALKTKWAHLRGALLSRSLLVVDEVHASDAYMA